MTKGFKYFPLKSEGQAGKDIDEQKAEKSGLNRALAKSICAYLLKRESKYTYLERSRNFIAAT